MENSNIDLEFADGIFKKFYSIGMLKDGGVTRLGYTEVEDEMHNMLISIAKDMGLIISTDEVGNTYISNTDSKEYYLIGSHLDSVIDGGRYDGVSGVIAGLLVLHWMKENAINLPIKVVAFRCEESSNFNLCTIGSGLITHEYTKDLSDLQGKNGEKLGDIFTKRGLNIHPEKISGMKKYLELHIEQGKVLDELHIPVGIVETIAGPRRFKLYLNGMAEHSGATPMDMRCDAMVAAAEMILAMEKIGKREATCKSVATVGVVNNHPNVMNVIPGECELGVDMRGIDKNSIDRMEEDMHKALKEICEKRNIEYEVKKIGDTAPVDMSKDVIEGLRAAAERLGIKYQVMPSGAGHDAMSFPKLCDTGMVFIPCEKGISHNRLERTTINDIVNGAKVMFEYLKEEV